VENMKKKVSNDKFLSLVNQRMAQHPECGGVTLAGAQFPFEDLHYSGDPPLSGSEECDRVTREIIRDLWEQYEVV
jgi:hypothetical protein